MDEDDNVQVQPIIHYNAMEEAANRYWRASRIWRDKEESNWNYGAMIQELNGIQCYRGRSAYLASLLLDDVVHDRRQPILELQESAMVVPMEATNDL